MLALKRKQGESVTLTLPDGRAIVVFISSWDNHVCKVAIEAPADVKILRTELIGQRP